MGVLMPVGTPGGINSGFAALPDGSGIVQLGSHTLALDGERYRMWEFTANVPSTETLMEWATALGIDQPDGLLRTLKDAELIVEERADPRILAGRVAIRFVGIGLGNGNDPASPFVLRGRDGSRVQCGLFVYEALLRSDGVRSILAICDEIQTEAPSEASFLGETMTSLPVLVRDGVVRLDAAVR